MFAVRLRPLQCSLHSPVCLAVGLQVLAAPIGRRDAARLSGRLDSELLKACRETLGISTVCSWCGFAQSRCIRLLEGHHQPGAEFSKKFPRAFRSDASAQAKAKVRALSCLLQVTNSAGL